MGSSAHGQWVLCTLMCMLCCMVLCSTNFLPRVEILLTAAKLSAEPQPVPMRESPRVPHGRSGGFHACVPPSAVGLTCLKEGPVVRALLGRSFTQHT